MTKKREGKSDQRKPESQVRQPAKFPHARRGCRCQRGRPRRQRRRDVGAREGRRHHQMGLRGGRARDRLGGVRHALRHPGADAGLRVLVIDQNFDVGGKMAALRRPDLSRWRRPVPAAGHRRRKRQGGVHQGRPAAQAGGDHRGHRFPVQGHHRLVGPQCRRPCPVSLQRTRAASCLGRQLLRHPAIPHGQLRPLRAHHRHALHGRRIARPAGDHVPHARRQDRHQGRNCHAPGRRNCQDKSSSHFAPRHMESAARFVAPGAVWNGAALTRGLEFSAREKGVQFMLNRRMTELVREQQFSGRVLGVKASYTPRFNPDTGAPGELSQNGNVDERRATINIRAKMAVFVGSGGHGDNPQFRSMFYPAFNEPAFMSSGWALLGPSVRTPAASSPACGSEPIFRACSRTSGSPRASTSRRDWRPATPTAACCPDTRPSRSAAPPASSRAAAGTNT